jgi:hypothetical protein
MFRLSPWILCIMALTILPVSASAEPAAIDQLAWMSGHWASDREGRWTEEHWLEPRGGQMLGLNRSGNVNAARAFEFLRIQTEEDGSLIYWAAPGGQPAVPFTLSEQSNHSVTFENEANDFPQRIHYQRQGDRLDVTISDASGERTMRWQWTLQ